jgi:membrane-associated phospholipid phosphatase
MSTLADLADARSRRRRDTLSRRAMSVPAAVAAAVLLSVGGYAAYRGLGALTGDVTSTAVANAERVDRLQRTIGIDLEGALQASWLATGFTGAALTWFYTFGYWPSIVGGLVVAAARDRAVLQRLAASLALSGAVGLVVIIAFPLAPPRLAGGADDHVARSELLSALAHPSAVFNPYAAMPSFHVAWTVLAALACARVVRGPGFVAAVWCVPATMSIAVVTTGNHWVLDVVAGATLAATAWWAAPHVLAVLRRNIRRRSPAAGDADDRRMHR